MPQFGQEKLSQIVHDAVVGIGLGMCIPIYGFAVWAPSAVFGYGGEQLLQYAATVGAIVNALAFLAIASISAFVARKHPAVQHGAWIKPLSQVLLGASFLMWLVLLATAGSGGPGVDEGRTMLNVVARCTSGAALAAAMLFWIWHIARSSDLRVLNVLSLAAVVSALGNLLANAISSVAGFLVIALICAEMTALASTNVHEEPQARGQTAPVGIPCQQVLQLSGGMRVAAKSLSSLIVASIAVSFVAPVVNTVLLADSLPYEMRTTLSGIATIILAMVLVLVWVLPKRTPSSFNILMGYSAVLVLLVVLLPLGLKQVAVPLLTVGSMGYFLVLFLAMEASIQTSREYGLPAPLVYGAATGIILAAATIADGIAQMILGAALYDETKQLCAAFLIVYLLTCSVFLLYGTVVRRRLTTSEGHASEEGTDFEQTDGETVAPQVESGLAPAADTIAERCACITQTFSLTRREAEVLLLMMRGRNVPAMAEELMLSRNTVQTHVRHVYEQLGVHSRRELVAFVETTEVSDSMSDETR